MATGVKVLSTVNVHLRNVGVFTVGIGVGGILINPEPFPTALAAWCVNVVGRENLGRTA